MNYTDKLPKVEFTFDDIFLDGKGLLDEWESKWVPTST
jgi:hypothetical protein